MSDWPQWHRLSCFQRHCFLKICWAVWSVLCSLLYIMWSVLYSLLYIMWSVLCSLLYIMWSVLYSLLYIMWNVLCSLLYIMWNVLCSLLYIMWNVLYSLLYIIKCWTQRSTVLRTLGGIFPWLIMEMIKFLLIDTGFEICHVCFSSPHHFHQILRHYSPAEIYCALSMTPLCY